MKLRRASVLPLISLLVLFASARAASLANPRSVWLSPAFEQFSGAPDLVWHAGPFAAKFGAGGRITLHSGGATLSPVSLAFPRANPNALAEGYEPLAPAALYIHPGRLPGERPHRFGRIRYRDLYPGVDLVVHAGERAIEYDFEIAPGANTTAIRTRIQGGSPVLNRNGDIEIFNGGRLTIVQKRPRAYQNIDGTRREVPCSYQIGAGGLIALRLGPYDTRDALVIDPQITFEGTFGGAGFDAAYASVADTAGFVYLAGESGSSTFGQPGLRASRDAFIAKLDPASNTLLYVIFIGGSGSDSISSLAIDSAGNVYAAGTTASADFPAATKLGPATGVQRAFFLKMTSAGAISYLTLLGSTGADQAFGIAVDSSQNVYVAGQTNAGTFPVTGRAVQGLYSGGAGDCFVSKIAATGTSLVYSTFLGGSGADVCKAIAVDGSGAAYVTGATSSGNFPVQNAIQSTAHGASDAFLARLAPDGSALLLSTYFGGIGGDEGNAIALDTAGAVYIAGDTSSPDFPTTNTSYQPLNKGASDAFLAKFAPGGASLSWSTLFGGTGSEAAQSLALTSSGAAVMAGFTNSADLPLQQAVQTRLAGAFDAFAAVFDSGGSRLLLSTYLGGANDDRAFAATNLSGAILLTGMTQSADFPSAGGGRVGVQGSLDLFVAELPFSFTATSKVYFYPTTPCRMVDTRIPALGASFGPPALAAGSIRSFPAASSACGLPGSALAYALNVTALPSATLGFLTVWPAGQPQPVASTLNSLDGRIVANAALIAAGSGGAFQVYAMNATHLLVDESGYFASSDGSSGLAFYPVPPCRVADTRDASFGTAFGPPSLAAGVGRVFPIPQSRCLPAGVAPQAYSLNLTVVPKKVLPYLTAWPAGVSMPIVSTLNAFDGRVVANAAIVGVGTNGSISLYGSDNTDVIVDINGYFAPPLSTGLSFYPLSPCRVADTRSSGGPLTNAAPYRTIGVAGVCGVPSTAQAYAFNVTAVPQGALGYLTIWPAGAGQPGVSTLNSYTGTVVANAAIVPAGSNGSISLFASGTTDVVLDVVGYFAP